MKLITDAQKKEIDSLLLHRLKGFVDEVRLVDFSILHDYIYFGRHANISDVVGSSSELYFAPDSLFYDDHAFVQLCWDQKPLVGFDLIFKHEGLMIYFCLTIRFDSANVTIRRLEMNPPEDNYNKITGAIVQALHSTGRLPIN